MDKHCMHLPTWDEIYRKEIDRRAGLDDPLDPVEQFIYDYEPQTEYERFREDLANLIDFVCIGKEQTKKEER